MKTEVCTVNIAGEKMRVMVREDGSQWVSLNGLCWALGLDREAAGARLKRSRIPHQFVEVLTPKGVRRVCAIPLDHLAWWLGTIETKNPELQKRVHAWRAYLYSTQGKKLMENLVLPDPTSIGPDLIFQDPRAVFLVTLGILYQRGDLPLSVVNQILGVMQKEASKKPSSPSASKVSVLELVEEKAESSLQQPPREPPVVEAVDGEKLAPLRVRPEGYLSAGGVVDRIKQIAHSLDKEDLLNRFVQASRSARTYSRSTLAKAVGRLARHLNIYPLPCEKESYTPPSENLDLYAIAVPLRQLQDKNGTTVLREVSHHVVYSPLAVTKMWEFLSVG